MTQQTIPIASITIPPNRQRRAFDEKRLRELAESLDKFGLLHPIVLRHEQEYIDGETEHDNSVEDCYYLVAGERRLRAMKLLEWTEAPFTLIQDLSDLELREAELEENVQRMDLTWQERSDALASLHKLRQEQNPSQTFVDTATEIVGGDRDKVGGVHMDVARATIVDAFKDDQEVQGARNLKDAERIAMRKMRSMIAQQAANLAKEDAAAAPETRHTLLHGSCQHYMDGGAFEPFRCIIADPPYGMNADQFGDAAKNAHSYKDDADYARSIMQTILDEGYQVTEPQAHLYMFCDIDQWEWLQIQAAASGWRPFRTPLIWSKGSSGHIPWGSSYWRRGYELVMFAEKGGHPLSKLVGDMILNFPPSRDREHGAQKPWELYKYFIELSCLPGERVLDPCCGSGPIFPAAEATQTIATGIEQDEETYQLALATLQDTARGVVRG